MRVLAAVIGAVAVAGLANTPAVPEAEAASLAAALAVQVGCSPSGECSATAGGGTGVYESWDWYGAEESFDGGGSWSSADASGYCVPGAAVQVAARVTDSSGASALGETFIFCPN